MQILKGVFLFLPSLSIFHVSANEVAPYSNCSSLCIYHPDDDITDPKATEIGPQDIVCHDWELNGPNSTSAGRRFHNCTKCLSTSEAQFSDPPYESDPYWFLFTIRYAILLCIFGVREESPSEAETHCSDACSGSDGGMRAALMDKFPEHNKMYQYLYCEDQARAFSQNVEACITCLGEVASSNSLRNYLRALDEGCRQHPSYGKKINLDFDLFATSLATISSALTSPSVVISATDPSVSSATTPSQIILSTETLLVNADTSVCDESNCLRALQRFSSSAILCCQKYISVPTVIASIARRSAISIATSLLPTASPESLVSPAPQPETLSQYLAFQVSRACACISVPDVATSTSTAVSPLASSPPSRSRKGLSLELGVGFSAAFMLISGAVGFILSQRRLQRQRMNLKNEPAGISTRNSDSQNPQSQNQWLPELDARDQILEADGGITNELGAGSGTYEYS